MKNYYIEDTLEVFDGRVIKFDWERYDEPDLGLCGYCINAAVDINTNQPITDDETLNELGDLLKEIYG